MMAQWRRRRHKTKGCSVDELPAGRCDGFDYSGAEPLKTGHLVTLRLLPASMTEGFICLSPLCRPSQIYPHTSCRPFTTRGALRVSSVLHTSRYCEAARLFLNES